MASSRNSIDIVTDNYFLDKSIKTVAPLRTTLADIKIWASCRILKINTKYSQKNKKAALTKGQL